MKIKSNDHDALNAAFAENVAGIEYHKPTPEEIASGSYYSYHPNFTRSADAVMPWLEKCAYWRAKKWEPNLVWVDLDAPKYGDAEAPTFPHAVVIAMLRANGVEVEDES